LVAFFWFLTMWAYVGYVERPNSGRLALTAAAFATGLLCKPMLVTLPVVLLLVDFWPLARHEAASPRRLFVEKLPLLALSLASSVITIYAQKRAGAMARLVEYPLGVRIGNAAVSTIAYLGKAIWPSRLSVFYPHPGAQLSMLAVLASGALIVAISILAIRTRRSHPYVTFGWFWYLVTLAPVFGLVQVGTQGMADRYTYIPLVGPFVALAWAVPSLLPGRRIVVSWLASGAAIALGIRAHQQASYWRDSVTLFEHALTVTTNNAVAHSNLGRAYLERGDIDSAMAHAVAVTRIEPDAGDGQYNLGVILEKSGKPGGAMEAYREAIRLAPQLPGAYLNLGILLAGEGQLAEAEDLLRQAVRLQPDSFSARNNLGAVLAGSGAVDEAIEQFEAASRLDPTNEATRENLRRARELREHRNAPPL
jgi:Tfp pilus assembly protein PilF